MRFTCLSCNASHSTGTGGTAGSTAPYCAVYRTAQQALDAKFPPNSALKDASKALLLVGGRSVFGVSGRQGGVLRNYAHRGSAAPRQEGSVEGLSALTDKAQWCTLAERSTTRETGNTRPQLSLRERQVQQSSVRVQVVRAGEHHELDREIGHRLCRASTRKRSAYDASAPKTERSAVRWRCHDECTTHHRFFLIFPPVR